MSTVYRVKNNRTKKIMKEMITTKTLLFFTKERAEYYCVCLERDSHLDGTAFNSVRPSTFSIEEYEVDNDTIVYYKHLKRYVQEINNKIEGVFGDNK